MQLVALLTRSNVPHVQGLCLDCQIVDGHPADGVRPSGLGDASAGSPATRAPERAPGDSKGIPMGCSRCGWMLSPPSAYYDSKALRSP